MDEIINKAMELFEIPSHRKNFLFLLPPFYIAKADGKISFKEINSICYNAIRLGLIGPQEQDSEDLDAFIEKTIKKFEEKLYLGDLDLLAKAINARLKDYTPEKAQEIRERIYELCVDVADASGPLFGDNITKEEKQMLERIFTKLEE